MGFRALGTRRHLRAIALLPGMAALVAPAVIVLLTGDVSVGWGLPAPWSAWPVGLGGALIVCGLALWARTVTLLATIGEGTLAPWDPTAHMVGVGPYRIVRNPMITGVLAILLGEAALLGSSALLAWFAAFLAVNAVYIPLVEEHGLARRFGADYEAYRARVPRWLPRRRHR